MYRKHRWKLGCVIILICLLSYLLKLDYSTVASEGITVVSIVLAIYMTSFSNLIASDLAEELKQIQDKEMKEKSQMGVLKGYLNIAVGTGIVNIVLGILVLTFEKKLGEEWFWVYDLICSVGFASLGANIYMMYLLYKFMVNRQMWHG